MIKIICFGKIKEKYLNDLNNDYLSRLKKYTKIEIIELKDNENIEIEKEELLKTMKSTDYNILLDINGDLISSENLAKLIDEILIINSNITFIIGSSNGIHNDLKSLFNKTISFGKNTYPHGLFRGILLEQIYRAYKINNNERYHK